MYSRNLIRDRILGELFMVRKGTFDLMRIEVRLHSSVRHDISSIFNYGAKRDDHVCCNTVDLNFKRTLTISLN